MANIDTSKIENFDTLSPEDQVKALLGVEIPDEVDMSAWVPKKTFDAKASEAAELGRKLKSKMTDDEKAAAEKEAERLAREQEYADLKTKYDEAVKRETIADFHAKLHDLGYEAKLAEETAVALVNGDMEKFFKNAAKYKDALEKKIKEDLMNGTPKPGGSGGVEKVMTKEDIFKITDPVERQDAIAANIGLFGG